MTCKLCRYFNRIGGHGGNCWRYPPTPMFITNENGDSQWLSERPWVNNNDWCGQYQEVRRDNPKNIMST